MPDTCFADLTNDVLTLRNRHFERAWHWNGGNLAGLCLIDRRTGFAWEQRGDLPDVAFPGIEGEVTGGAWEQTRVTGHPYWVDHLLVTARWRQGGIAFTRTLRLFPEAPAIVSQVAVEGTAEGTWLARKQPFADKRNVEQLADAFIHENPGPRLDRLTLPRRHVQFTSVRFYDITDQRNNLVAETRVRPYRSHDLYRGNLMLVEETLSGDALFVLKEAPCSDVQVAYPGGDFMGNWETLDVIGCGFEPDDLPATAFGTVIGVGGLDGLRAYQHATCRDLPDRDHFVMANTWGDRSQDSRMNQAFVMDELEACHRHGISHLQLDDGWQTGRSSNSAFQGGTLENIWSRDDYWQVHPERFPDGLAPVLASAAELGVEVCLWFNPAKDDDYANWEKDADTILGLWREHGIRIFKIDGVILRTYRANANLRAMFEKVVHASGGQVVFNLDVTAGRRWGYHLGREYGTLFLENRYTDWGLHYPHATLRNLWQLARYVPPQSLQIEFLNLHRNADRYPADDPLAPAHVPFEYAFAATMMAQPLAWMEVQNLPAEAAGLTTLISTYRQHQLAIHSGRIMPIGDEPCGVAWTGFQSVAADGSGYLLILRELNLQATCKLPVHAAPGSRLQLTPVLGEICPRSVTTDDEGRLPVSLPGPFTFALWRYAIA